MAKNPWKLFEMAGDVIVLGVHESKRMKGPDGKFRMYFRRIK